MYTEEKKKNTNYGSIFIYCFFCFVFVVEVVRFVKPYYNIRNFMETEATIEEGFLNMENSGAVPCHSGSGSSHHKLSTNVREETRKRPPVSYCLKVQSFSTLSKLVKDNPENKYESQPFSVGGYNWTFIIYPNENKPEGSGGDVSLYVRIDNSTFINNPTEVYAWIKFVTYKSTWDIYHELQATEVQRFHLFKQEYGMINFLGIGYYRDKGQGFIFNGEQSVFGVDISVSNPTDWEELSYDENIRDPLFTWKLTKFSMRGLDSYTSDPFSSGGRNWVFKVYPNGAGSAVGNSLSFYLLSASNEKGYVVAKLRVINQKGSNHVEKQVSGWPNATESGWGFDKFIPLSDIKDTSKGFLVDDAITFEVEFASFTKTKVYTV
ncbi:unnamed protein product [Cochlearia groenlandica]